MRLIVVGYDGSAAGERAVERAAEVARAFGARVTVVSAAAPPPIQPLVDAGAGAFGLLPYYGHGVGEPGAAPAATEALWQQHRAEVERRLAAAGAVVDFAGVVGEPAERIVEVAEERGADLVVVGANDRGFLDRLFAGSVGENVARRAPCDVLVVHPRRTPSADRTESASGDMAVSTVSARERALRVRIVTARPRNRRRPRLQRRV